MNQHIYKMIS